MIVDRNYIERSEGAKLLVEFCENLADELNIQLIKEPQWVLSIKDEAKLSDYCQLIIVTATGSTAISLSHEEIENYSINVDSNNVEAKITSKLEMLKL